MDIYRQRPSQETAAGHHADCLRHHKNQRAVHNEHEVPIAGNGWQAAQSAPSNLTGILGLAHVKITLTTPRDCVQQERAKKKPSGAQLTQSSQTDLTPKVKPKS